MAKRKIATVLGKNELGEPNGRRVEVYYNTDWKEYRCTLYIQNTLQKTADYFTTDRSDAMGTAALMAKDRAFCFYHGTRS